MRCPLSSRHDLRRGAIAVQVTLCLTIIVGVAAVTVDGGLMLAERQHAQATADAAALAAAVDLANNYGSLSVGTPDGGTSAKTSAVNVASANGYTITTSDVHIPPTSGYFTSTATYLGYVEVIVTYNQPRYFSSIFGSGSVPIKARAVARGKKEPGYWNASILTLDPNAAKGLELSGGSDIQVPRAIIVDSTTSTALRMGTSSYMIASSIHVVGGSDIASGDTVTPTPTYGSPSTSDPLSTLAVPPWPDVPATPSTGWNGYVDNGGKDYIAPTGSTTIYPGRYVGISVGGGSTVTMSPGIYYLYGKGSSSFKTLLVSGATASLTGNGVLIYNGEWGGSTSSPSSVGSINIQSSSTVTLTPMSSGTWQGINIFQERGATAQITISGGSGTNVAGMVYAPDAPVNATGGSDIVPGSAFVVASLSIGGGGTMILPTPTVEVPVNSSNTPQITLVE